MVLICLATIKLQAQDSVLLNETVILSDRFTSFSSSQITTAPDSIFKKINALRNLQDVLAEQSQVFVKNYGAGNIATASLRGTGAEHTAIVWNGINLQSPILGQVDLSIIPFSATDNISIRLGGNGALYGSGAIGGAIHLDNKPLFQKSLQTEIAFQGGNAERFNEMFGVSFGNKTTSYKFHFIQQNAENNFSYKNSFIAGSPLMTLKHARTELSALFGNAWFKSKNSNTGFHLWIQNANRQIPPGLSTVNTGAEQHDQSIRISVDQVYYKHHNQFSWRAAYLDDKINYSDSLRSLQSNTSSKSLITEVEYKFNLSNLLTGNIGVNNTYNTAIGASYSKVEMNRTALFTSLEYKSNNSKFTLGGSLRSEVINESFLPIIPEIHSTYKLNKSIVILASLSRSYRIPTFNEKNWNPGGNPNLKSESGLNAEFSVNHNFQHNTMSLSGGFTCFGRDISNWILWVPTGSYWSPENILKVRTLGLEWRETLMITLNRNSSLKGIISINSISSKIINSSNTSQLPYIPRITHQYAIIYLYKVLTVSYTHTYTGMRYLDYNNVTALPSFQVANLRLNTQFSYKKLNLNLFTEITNLYNASYTVIPDRIMPGRLFSIGINLNHLYEK